MSYLRNLLQRPKPYRKSFAQQGEDLVVDFLLERRGIRKPFYLDIGCNHAQRLSNTYYFYLKGGRGVCVDPNIELGALYRRKRPGDVFLPMGVTGGKTSEADYFMMNWHEFNTFDEAQAREIERSYQGRNDIKSKVRLPISNINEILRKYCNRDIDFLSLDVEGLDYEILRGFDFKNFSPKVICLEMKSGPSKTDEKAEELLKALHYKLSASNEINSIFELV